MNDTEYELLHYLADKGRGNGNTMHPIDEFDIDVIKAVGLQGNIRTNSDRTQGQITGKGVVAHAVEHRKRQGANQVVDDVDSDDIGGTDFKRPESNGNGLSGWEQTAMENLSESQLFALDEVRSLSLARFDHAHAWVRANIHHITRKSLVKYSYLEYDDERDLCRLTDSGLKKNQ